jgi:hypothetical protein
MGTDERGQILNTLLTYLTNVSIFILTIINIFIKLNLWVFASVLVQG